MAETYGLDVALVRVLWLIAVFLQIGVPAYIICWIAIPPSSAPRRASGPPRHPETWGTLIAGVIGVTLGSMFLGHMWRLDHFGAPLLLIGGGVAILLLRRRDDARDNASADEPSVPVAEPTTEPPAPESSAGESPSRESPTASTAPTTTATVPATAWTQTRSWPTGFDARAQRRASRIERRSRRPRSFLTPLTLSLLLIGAGVACLVQATGAANVNLTGVLALATCVVGAALVAAAFVGRAHTLIFVGLILLAATAVSSSLDVPLRGGIGSRHYDPQELSELHSPYRLGIGDLRIDLRDLPLAGRTTTVAAELGVGHLVVFVPNSVRVEARGHAGAGSVKLFGFQQGGWPQDDEHAAPGSGTGVLELDLRVGAGMVDVRRFDTSGYETILGDN
jgi:Cell wall-active antibiotics response 4TMS YvqF/PspC domain